MKLCFYHTKYHWFEVIIQHFIIWKYQNWSSSVPIIFSTHSKSTKPVFSLSECIHFTVASLLMARDEIEVIAIWTHCSAGLHLRRIIKRLHDFNHLSHNSFMEYWKLSKFKGIEHGKVQLSNTTFRFYWEYSSLQVASW